MKRTLLAASLTILSVNALADTMIYAGQLIDGKHAVPSKNKTIIIKDDKIIAIKAGFVTPSSDDVVIDYSKGTVMPGFIDMHTHLSYQGGPKSYMEPFTLNPADIALRGSLYARKTLDAGFTTIRDLGDSGNASVALRTAIAKGYIQGPRIYTAGTSIATTGGHADHTNGRNLELMGDPGPKHGVINGVEDAFKAVRQRYKEGADLIKITATGGVLSVAKSGQNPQFTDNELEAIVTAAKDYGFKVAVHGHGKEGIKRAILAGVDTIEHGTYLDDELFSLMKKNDVALVPTLSAGAYVAEKAKIDGFFPEVVRPKAATIGPKIQGTFAKAYKAGVTIAFGTDAGVFAHGENGKEFKLMVDAGMPPIEAIRSATYVAAERLGEDNIGHIAKGKWADLVGVDGDPLQEVELLEAPNLVIKAGKVLKQ
ncbi:amidohydrolase family protein [Shewanella sp. 202IG2-18]|uniref:metal-dependent hydrolase family protein n=1 Tax=Parashewanella hymeniacidonis TaxID=2807618 RepID=UPI00195F61AF|nr:amidohydrolase family protein [Parashewanella hymeniacidonis]MBM7072570.1 amidohydrolase family protein [Parashewanella hymeniacidonis]